MHRRLCSITLFAVLTASVASAPAFAAEARRPAEKRAVQAVRLDLHRLAAAVLALFKTGSGIDPLGSPGEASSSQTPPDGDTGSGIDPLGRP